MSQKKRKAFRLPHLAACFLGLTSSAWLTGCQSLPQVAAWEKAYLAEPAMALEPDPLDRRFTEHIYFSREASSGGAGIGGGGCGCN
jgi:hypothetical protein